MFRLVGGLTVVLSGPLAARAGARPIAIAEPSTRPAFELAIGFGVSRDGTGLVNGGTASIPAFVVMGGFGDGPVGLDISLVSTTALGRYGNDDLVVDRLGTELLAVVRPGALVVPRGVSWRARTLRGLAFALGPVFERVTTGKPSATRAGLRVGVHGDVPITPRAATDLRVRLGLRRILGFEDARLSTGNVGDSQFEAFGALAVVF